MYWRKINSELIYLEISYGGNLLFFPVANPIFFKDEKEYGRRKYGGGLTEPNRMLCLKEYDNNHIYRETKGCNPCTLYHFQKNQAKRNTAQRSATHTTDDN